MGICSSGTVFTLYGSRVLSLSRPGCLKSGANCLAVAWAISESSLAWSAAMSACSAFPRAVAVLKIK